MLFMVKCCCILCIRKGLQRLSDVLQYVIINYRKSGKYLYNRSNSLKELEGDYIADTDLQSDSYK